MSTNNIVYLKKSTKQASKYMVLINGKTIHFGAAGYSDYTINKDPERRSRYISRHQKKENWTSSGIMTAGFWSRYLLWEKTTITEAIKYIELNFNVKIKRCNK
jgi:hypothetical protein